MPITHTHESPRHDPFAGIALAFADPLDEDSALPAVSRGDLPSHTQSAMRDLVDDAALQPEWSEDDIVHLHWRLLLELRRLPDPDTPLEEKFDTLAWALTDPSLDSKPFSFANCLRVVGTSPLSPTPYFGELQVDDIRDWLRIHAPQWIRATLARYPDWVASLVCQQPDWVARQLARNPQWINEQVRARQAAPQADLFAVSVTMAA
jgi:hypothetical protein